MPVLRRKLSEIHRKRIAVKLKGNRNAAGTAPSLETRKLISAALKRAYKRNPKFKKFQSDKMLKNKNASGTRISAEVRARMSAAMRGKKHIPRELPVEAKVSRWAKRAGYLAFKVDPRYARGAPDRMFLLPNGQTIFIEFKTPGRFPTKKQANLHRKLKRLNHAVFVFSNAALAIAFLKERA